MSEIAANETLYAVCNIEKGITEENIQGRVFFKQQVSGLESRDEYLDKGFKGL